MSDEPEDGSDWLASQFNPTEQVARPVPPVPDPPTVPFVPPAAPPPAFPPPAVPSPAMPPPAPNPNGGFNWGLRPGGAADQPTPPASEPVQSVPSVPAPAFPPPAAPVFPPPAAPPLTSPVAAEPTAPLNWNDFAATQQHGFQPAPPVQEPRVQEPPTQDPLDQPTEAYTVLPWQPTVPYSSLAPAGPPAATDESDPTSAIDALFGEQKFQDYEDVGVLKALQTLPPTADEPAVREPRAPLPTSQKVLMGVAGALMGVLILIGLFFFGEHLGSAQAEAPIPTKTPGATPVPTPAGTGGPAAPGQQQWSALQGGECIQSFSSAWAQTFTVVACTADHNAEMVFKGKLPDSSSVAYPTAASFKQQLTQLCSAPTAINYGAAAAVTDLQVSFSYPPNTSAWLAGDRTYYCFVDRTSGSNLTGDLAVPKTSGGS